MSLLPRFFLLFCCFCFFQKADAAPAQYAFRIAFTDKAGSPPLSAAPAWLSARSIARRDSLGIALDSTDRPVSPDYLDSVLRLTSGKLHNASRWLNQCVVLLTDSSKILSLAGKPFVRSIDWVGFFGNGLHMRAQGYLLQNGDTIKKADEHSNAKQTGSPSYYGAAWPQTTMVNGDYLHDLGYRGEGQLIVVLDEGFTSVATHPGFDSMRNAGRLLETYDFVHNAATVTASDHGSQCLSTMAGLLPGTYVGSAPGAAFALYATEDVTATDIIYELDNLVAGMERADSIGADVISCSLGYNDFVSPYIISVTKAELNGHSTIVARAVNLAVSKGILYVSSSGNEGGNSWDFLLTPSDADSALTVGSVNSDRTASGFSSPGPNSSGRVKPDVCLLGGSASVFGTSGSIFTTSGSSFSAPQAAGYAACLRQAFPKARPGRIRDAIARSADRAGAPTAKLGYGIPDFKKVFNSLAADAPVAAGSFYVSPNPFGQTIRVSMPAAAGPAQVSLFDALGRAVSIHANQHSGALEIAVSPSLPPGLYVLRVVVGNAVITQKLQHY